MDTKMDIKRQQPAIISEWQKSSPMIAIGLLNAFQLALILQKLSGKGLTPELEEKTMIQTFDLLLNLNINLRDVLTNQQVFYDTFHEKLRLLLKTMEKE